MQGVKKLRGSTHLSLVDKDEDQFSEKVLDCDGEPVFARQKTKNQSGIRQRVVAEADSVDEREASPERFLVLFHYHYPAAVFSKALISEITLMENFFGVSRNQKGEGTVVDGERLYSTLTYRINMPPMTAEGFSRAVKEILRRHGVDIMKHDLDKT